MTPGQKVLDVTDVPAAVFSFDDLPALHGSRPKNQPLRPRERREYNRRAFIERVVGVGMALGLASLTVFPPARALANGYRILNSCPGYAAGHQCSPGCGPSTVRQAACTDKGWHEHTGCFYRLRPDQCADGTWDGWMWRVTGCSQCGTAKTGFRCHDGKTCPDDCGGCYATICRSFRGCS